MTIETKYNIGDEVWIDARYGMSIDEWRVPVHGKVVSISIYHNGIEAAILYRVNYGENKEQYENAEHYADIPERGVFDTEADILYAFEQHFQRKVDEYKQKRIELIRAEAQ